MINRQGGFLAFGNTINYFLMQVEVNKSLVSEGMDIECERPLVLLGIHPGFNSPPCRGIHEQEC